MSVIWGVPYLLIKVAVEGVSVPVLVLARTAIGAAVLLPLSLSRPAWALVLRHWKPVLAFAFFEVIAAWLLLSDAERHLTSSLTGLLIAASPIIAAVLDRFTGGERVWAPSGSPDWRSGSGRRRAGRARLGGGTRGRSSRCCWWPPATRSPR